MKHLFLLITFSLFCIGIPFIGWSQSIGDSATNPYQIQPQSTLPFQPNQRSSNIDMKTPENIVTEVEYDETTNQYILHKKVGAVDIATPYTMSFEEYLDYDVQKKLKGYWRERYKSETFEHQSSIIPKINVGSEAFETIFGSNTIDIKPNGSASLKFGIKMTNNENPNQPVELRKNTTFDFKEEIQMSVVGKIGENLEMKVSYDTESQFDFDNTMNLRYQGKEDDILQKVEAGDVSMPMTTSLITGSQSLFGLLTELKFGNLYVTSIFSQQQGETKTITVEGGAQKSTYDISAVNYDKNRHFFLAHNFRTNYDKAMENAPLINSGIVINKIEVWVTNTKKETTTARNIAAFVDLGEEMKEVTYYGENETVILDNTLEYGRKQTPDNNSNSLYEELTSAANSQLRNINDLSRILFDWGYQGGKQYEKVEFARKLATNEYTVDEKLGYISLNSSLNSDEVLAVAYEYTLNGETYKVGEFSQDGVQHPNVLFLKLLKGTNFNPILPNWKLMLKNIYAIGAYQVSKEDFKFEVEYYDDNTGTRILNIPDKNKVLTDSMRNEKFLRHLGLDNYNSAGNYVASGDGVFDFSEGLTIIAASGRIIFPVLEPFGRYMNRLIPDKALASKLTFRELYDSTQYKAEQITSKNKFYLTGNYKSSGGSEIFLNSFNIPEGSVKVMAGGIVLQPNVDYSVDYNLGRVKILNDSYLASGTPIKISLESNSMFSIQSKTLMGSHFEYRFSNDFNLGGTIMNLTERPLTEKVNMGEEPISNTIWGLNGSYRTDVPILTRAIDLLPFLETKEMSSVTTEGEFAQLIPGHNKAIGKEGNAFIDDFEGSESSIDLKNKVGWSLSSIPQGQPLLFPEASDYNNLTSGYNRAKLAWYQIDPLFFRSGSPVSEDQQSHLQVYRPDEQEIFPNKFAANGIPTEISTLDLAFYPDERGPYNFDAAGINSDGKLELPEERWGGIMRELTTKDFESQNVEYIMFWMMDPFVEEDSLNNGGKLYFNLGNVSEDILKDGRKSYENGLPTNNPPLETEYYTTQWGRVPAVQALTTDFVNDPALRPLQDVGFDGLSGTILDGTGKSAEQNQFSNFLSTMESKVTNPDALASIRKDPSADDYHYFRGGDYDDQELGILERYKEYSNSEGNTPVSENTNENYNTVGQSSPDVEDINSDFTLSENEAYYQYEIDLKKENMEAGSIHITDIQTATVTLKNGDTKQVNWYQFKVPISNPNQRIGAIQDFKSIRFMRMFMKGWESSIVLRFAKLELVRSEWRKYDYTLSEGGEAIGGDQINDPNDVPFSISSVNIEENGSRKPVNYVLPPGVDRQQDPSNPQLNKLNEQSMALKVSNLEDGYAKAVYKTLNMDMRDYKHLQMYIHSETMFEEDPIDDYDVSCFVRLGSDFTDNYYEYEVPLKVTPPWVTSKYSEGDAEIVWPKENNLDIDFETLVAAKLARNEAMRKANSELSYIDEFTYYNGSQRIIVKGNPNIAQVKTFMIGVRNPKARYNQNTDDGQPKSAEIWVNELRLTDFNEKGGWAATGRVTARLADFGTLSVAGSTTQPGFGSIEQSGQERAKEETNQIDLATNLDLGKFFPKEANLRVPLFMGYSRIAINPEYNPLDQDVKMETTLNDPSLSEAEKESLVKQVQDITERKSLNFTNVGIGQSGKGKPRFYSPSNLSASYAYNELAHHDVGIDHNSIKTYNASLNYVFNNQPKNYEPFKKSKLLKKKALRLIGDFNFYLAPQQLSFQTSMDRRYSETLLRNLNNPEQIFTPTYDKNFYWKRKFDMKYNFSKGLKFTFATNTNAIIIEPEGEVNKESKDSYQIYKETVWNSIQNYGTPNAYNQAFDASYTIPINKIPLLDFISSNARYAATYEWLLAPTMRKDTSLNLNMGNNIKNNQQITLNAQLNMDNLYNKISFIEKTNKKYKQTKAQRNKPKFEEVSYIQKEVNFKAGTAKRINHALGTEEDIKLTVKSVNGKELKADFDIINENRIEVTLAEAADSASIEVKGKKQINDNWVIIGLEKTLLLVTGFKQFSGTLTQTQGTFMSGYKPNHQFGELATNPGLPFIFGWQDTAFARTTALKGDLIDSTRWVSPYTMTNNVTYSFKSTYQPFKELRIDFGGQQSQTHINSEYYYIENNSVNTDNRKESGTYNINIWMLNSAFANKPDSANQVSEAFEQYKTNLSIIAWRLAGERSMKDPTYHPTSDSVNMPTGYSSQNPEVAIPAFLSSYGGFSATSVALNFRSLYFLRPTWRIKYDGLTNIDFLAKYFKTISLSHGYTALFSVGSFSSTLNWDYFNLSDTSSLFQPKYDISSFTASEQFIPLFGIDVTWKNNMLTKFEYKKTRNLTMSLSNNQMAEVYTWEYTIGTGYRFDKLKLKIKTPGGATKPLESDLNVRGDISIRDNLTMIHDLNQGTNQVTQGQKVITTKITADYQLSEKLMLTAYYDRLVTTPKVGSFKQSVTEFGFKFQFTL